ncbi:MAG: multiprotein-bridging factor 1 [Stictis urceolatum]|nr:multiprotein-bridging factor 1 [Stictis urceolata]
MSDDWDSVTKIGSKTRGGPSTRETVVKGKSALNAAQRTGAVLATEKKFGSINAADKSTEGARLTKVDRTDDVVAPQKLDSSISNSIKNRRAEEGFKMTQAQLAQKVNVSANDIKTLESGAAIKNQQLLNKVCRVLKISPKTGQPLPPPGKK